MSIRIDLDAFRTQLSRDGINPADVAEHAQISLADMFAISFGKSDELDADQIRACAHYLDVDVDTLTADPAALDHIDAVYVHAGHTGQRVTVTANTAGALARFADALDLDLADGATTTTTIEASAFFATVCAPRPELSDHLRRVWPTYHLWVVACTFLPLIRRSVVDPDLNTAAFVRSVLAYLFAAPDGASDWPARHNLAAAFSDLVDASIGHTDPIAARTSYLPASEQLAITFADDVAAARFVALSRCDVLTVDDTDPLTFHLTLASTDPNITADAADLLSRFTVDPHTATKLHPELTAELDAWVAVTYDVYERAVGLVIADDDTATSDTIDHIHAHAPTQLTTTLEAAYRDLCRHYHLPLDDDTPVADPDGDQAGLVLTVDTDDDHFTLELTDDGLPADPYLITGKLASTLKHITGNWPTSATMTTDANGIGRLLDRLEQLARTGVTVELPTALTRTRRANVTFDLATHDRAGVIDLDRVATLQPTVTLDDGTTTDLDALANLTSQIVDLGDGWTRLHPDDLARIRAAKKAVTNHQRLDDPTTVALTLAGELDADGHTFDIAIADTVTDYVARRLAYDPATPADLTRMAVDLYGYQQTGATWLQQMTDNGWGVLLSDQMGLGKTAQAISLMAATPGPHLVIAPKSVLTNWARELATFAPHLDVHVHTGAERARHAASLPTGADTVIVTNYELVNKDLDILATTSWQTLCLDEAHAIKNPKAKVARAIHHLPAARRVALTGTPVSNRTSDLWSIFAFLNPGLLGTDTAFRRVFARPIDNEADTDRLDRLNRILDPFTLRRTLDDAGLDIPSRTEIDEHVELTREQADFYTTIQKAGLAEGFGDDFGRGSRVLAMLTKLKQISNHPDSCPHIGRHGKPTAGRSGKLNRCDDIVDAAIAGGEKTIIFTQYATMGRMLAEHYTARTGHDIALFDGQLSVSQRDAATARFAETGGPPVLIMQLKAGGVGLNLTCASRVIHYDLWWNYASEDQASSRAHRNGQTRPVIVHRLISAGTFDDEVNRINEQRRGLADALNGTDTLPDFSSWSDDYIAAKTQLHDTAA